MSVTVSTRNSASANVNYEEGAMNYPLNDSGTVDDVSRQGTLTGIFDTAESIVVLSR